MQITPRGNRLNMSGTSHTKEMGLTKIDKIQAFNLLIWASLCSIFLSFWQILIPFRLFSQNFSQLCLGYTSIFFLLLSLIMLYWSNKNHQILKETHEENPILHTLHIEGAIYMISFLLIAFFMTFFIGIVIQEGYSRSLLQAQGETLDKSYRQTVVLITTQCILIAGDIATLVLYAKSCYHLEILPIHLPSVLGLFFATQIVSCSALIGHQNYLRSYVGNENMSDVQDSENIHHKIFLVSVALIVVTLVLIYENRSVQLNKQPKTRFYIGPFFLYLVYGIFLLVCSLQFYQSSSLVNRSTDLPCKQTLQKYDQQFVNSIGCPEKYKTYTNGSLELYSQDCLTQETGIVWELDYDKEVSQLYWVHTTLYSICINMLTQQLYIKQAFIVSGHALDLGIQRPSSVKGTPATFSALKLALLYSIAFFAIISAGFSFISSVPTIPRRFPDIQRNEKNFNYHIANYTYDDSLQSINTCSLVSKVYQQDLVVHFDTRNCPLEIQHNRDVCNIYKQGFQVCLEGNNGVFQLNTAWKSQFVRINSNTALNRQKINLIAQDKFCAFGSEAAINYLLEYDLYICKNSGKEATITFQSKQIELDFIDSRHQSHANEEQDRQLRNLMQKNIKKQHDDYPNDKYASIKLNIYASQKSLVIENAKVFLFRNTTQCKLLNDINNQPIILVHSDQKGIAIIYNILIEKDTTYMVQIRADGYYYNCYNFIELKNNEMVEKFIPLVEQMNEDENVKVLLSYQNDKLNFQLGSNYKINETAVCYSGYFMSDCGDINYSIAYKDDQKKQERPAQVLTIKLFARSKYIFFVELIPQSLTLRNKVHSYQDLNINEKQEIDELNQAFVNEEIFFSIYVRNREFPVTILATPTSLPANADRGQNQFWLALCINGSQGPKSITSIDQFWSRRQGISTLPNSDLCETPVSSLKATTLGYVKEAVDQAVSRGGQFCILGETFNSFYAKKYLIENAEDFEDEQNRLTYNTMKEIAEKNKIYLVGTIPEKEKISDKLFNTALCFDPNGSLIAKYRKSHLFDIDIPGKITYKESDIFSPGDQVVVFDTEFGRIGLGICYDVRFPEFAQVMRLKGALMLIYPGAFNQVTGPLHYELLHRARAVDYQVYLAGVSTATHKQDTSVYQAWGHSLLVDPLGKVLAQGGSDPFVEVVDIDFQQCEEVRNNIPTFSQRRNDYYELIVKK